jgi:long-chain fatty acid transport protein
MSRARNTLRTLALALLSTASPLALAGGTEIPNQGAAAAAQAEAFMAQADDPSAIYYNPAGITQLHGTVASAGIYALFPEWTFHADAGDGQVMDLPSYLPHSYLVSDFGLERWRVGFGVNNVFGMNEDWGNKGPLRFLSNIAQLAVINLQPTVAYQVNDNLSVGLGFNIYYGQLLMTRNVALGPPPFPEGDFHFRGDAWSYGVSPGILWKINDRHTLAAMYRSPFTLNFDGDASVKAPGVKVGPSRSHVTIDFPQMAGVAYAYRPIKPLKLEFDVVWTDWNTYDSARLSSNDPNFNGIAVPADWMSGFSYRFGTQYDINRNWAVRAGYAYGQNAIPSDTYSPLVPDSTYHLFTVGLGYKTDKWGVDAAYQYAYRERRSISGDSVNSPAVDGSWENNIHTLMLTLTFKL